MSSFSNQKSQSQRQHDRNPQHKRRKAIGVEEFVSGGKKKGIKRAIKEYKYRKDRKIVEKAKLLRQYKKAMKKEGYEAGSGASRKRIRTNDDDGSDGSDDHDDNNSVDSDSEEAIGEQVKNAQDGSSVSNNDVGKSNSSTKNKNKYEKKIKKHKYNPLTKALEKREEIRKQHEQMQKDKIGKQKEYDQKQKQRKRRAREMSKRTKKGQPIMKNMIHNMLDRLEK